MDQNHLEAVAMPQVTQLTGEVHVSYVKDRQKAGVTFRRYVTLQSSLKQHRCMCSNIFCVCRHVHETTMTVAGAACVSANLRRLWRSLSSAAFLAVALMCATVT